MLQAILLLLRVAIKLNMWSLVINVPLSVNREHLGTRVVPRECISWAGATRPYT
jgi:hypothetical protein